jgi:hypothetical protein
MQSISSIQRIVSISPPSPKAMIKNGSKASINYQEDSLYISPSTMNIMRHGANRWNKIKSSLEEKQLQRLDSLILHKS